jgi:hypothetical protein
MNPRASGPWIASVGLFVVAWLTLSAAFYASPWALVLLVLLIPEAMAVSALARANKPIHTMVVPMIGTMVWFLAVFAGAKWLGWGA